MYLQSIYKDSYLLLNVTNKLFKCRYVEERRKLRKKNYTFEYQYNNNLLIKLYVG